MGAYSGCNRTFRFEVAWIISHADFDRLIANNWIGNSSLIIMLSNLTTQLKDWNNNTFGNIFERKKNYQD